MTYNEELTEKIQCLECGKYFLFLAPHLNKAHQISAREYRERWNIPLHTPLASASHSRQCRENVLRRIRQGEIDPDEQLMLMAKGRSEAPERTTSTRLHKVTARNVAQTYQIWKYSPVVKLVPEVQKAEAIRRMAARTVTGEKVKAIAEDLNLSVGCLYKWMTAAK